MNKAIEDLRSNQRQLDNDGCHVGVSRQALTETLDMLDAMQAILAAISSGKAGEDAPTIARVGLDYLEFTPREMAIMRGDAEDQA